MLNQYPELVKEFTSEEYLEAKFRADYSKEARANILTLLQILISERKLYSTNKTVEHKIRVESAKDNLKTILDTKEPVLRLKQ